MLRSESAGLEAPLQTDVGFLNAVELVLDFSEIRHRGQVCAGPVGCRNDVFGPLAEMAGTRARRNSFSQKVRKSHPLRVGRQLLIWLIRKPDPSPGPSVNNAAPFVLGEPASVLVREHQVLRQFGRVGRFTGVWIVARFIRLLDPLRVKADDDRQFRARGFRFLEWDLIRRSETSEVFRAF
jgi:hypothetical protein